MSESKRANDPVAALAALYQGEKTDASYVFNTAMAMMGIAVAYLIGAIPFVETLSHRPFGWLFVVLLPVPLWLVVAFHSLITLNAMRHGISIRIIENALFEASELRVSRDLVGSAAGDKIMDITQAKPVHRLTTFVVYVGVGLLVLGFTVCAVYFALGALKRDVAWMCELVFWWIAIVVYVLLVILVARSWIVGFRTIREGRDGISARSDAN